MLKKSTKKSKEKEQNPQKSINLVFSQKAKVRKIKFAAIFLILLVAGFLSKSIFFAASVNGVPISRLAVIKELEKTLGKDILDNLINKKLIVQEARSKNINVSDEEVADEIEKISSTIEEQGSTLEDVLGIQNQTIENLQENIRIQKMVEKLLSEKIKVENQEVRDYFEDNKEYFGEDTSFEEVKDDIQKQLENQKLSSEYATFIENLKQESNIIYFVNF